MDFDAIVVGSGISGGWVAKELCERGPEDADHRARPARRTIASTTWISRRPGKSRIAAWCPRRNVPSTTPSRAHCHAFNAATRQWWVRDSEHPYSTPDDRPFRWIRGYHLGGRSITWGRQTLPDERPRLQRQQARRPRRRLADSLRGPFALVRPCRTLRRHLRRQRRSRATARRAVPAAAWRSTAWSSRSSKHVEARPPDAPRHRRTLRAPHRAAPPNTSRSGADLASCAACASAVAATARISPRCPPRCRPRARPAISPSSPMPSSSDSTTTTRKRRISGVRVIDSNTRAGPLVPGARRVPVRVDHRHRADPAGLALGIFSERPRQPLGCRGPLPDGPRGRHRRLGHASGFPRSLLLRAPAHGLLSTSLRQHHRKRRAISCAASDSRATRAAAAGGAARAKRASAPSSSSGCARPGRWEMQLIGFGEMLPRADNRVTLDERRKDKWGIPLVHIDCTHGENERRLGRARQPRCRADARRRGLREHRARRDRSSLAGHCVHEMGTARMGRDPATSVLNRLQPGARRGQPVRHRRVVHDLLGHA